jgi:integrase
VKRLAKTNGCPPIYIDIDLPKIRKKKKMQIISKSDEKIILDYITKNEKKKYIGVLLSLMTGLRIGELCALKWEDVDLKRRIIVVNKTLSRISKRGERSKIVITVPKTENSERNMPISNTLYEYLQSIKPKEKDLFFLTFSKKSTEPRNYRKIYNNLLKKLKLSPTSFHALRHTFATRLVENKVDVKTISELLGHSSIGTTMQVYIHSEFSTKRKAMKTLDNLL